MKQTPKLPKARQAELLEILAHRFEKNKNRHPKLQWAAVRARLEDHPGKLWAINDMELTGGEPDVIGKDPQTGQYLWVDCSPETPQGRRSLCYDPDALDSRKEHKPKNSAIGLAAEMGIELLDEQGYQQLQQLGSFDQKTSSWIATPDSVRKLGGAIFGDRRFGRIFVYHNGAESYYAGRGFRGRLLI